MGKKTDERLRSPFGNLRLHVSCFSPIKKATSFPLNPSAERGRSFYLFPRRVHFRERLVVVVRVVHQPVR